MSDKNPQTIEVIPNIFFWVRTPPFTHCPKITNYGEKLNFQKITKLWILIFDLKNQLFLNIFNGKNILIVWILAPKIVILFKNRINKNCPIMTFFGAKIQILTEINSENHINSFIFGTKIQIHNLVHFSENWIFGQNLRFSDSVLTCPRDLVHINSKGEKKMV